MFATDRLSLVSSTRRWRIDAGPVLGTASSTDTDTGTHRTSDRAAATVALDEHQDRSEARDGGLDGLCGAGATGIEPALETRPARTTEPLLPSSRRRAR